MIKQANRLTKFIAQGLNSAIKSGNKLMARKYLNLLNTLKSLRLAPNNVYMRGINKYVSEGYNTLLPDFISHGKYRSVHDGIIHKMVNLTLKKKFDTRVLLEIPANIISKLYDKIYTPLLNKFINHLLGMYHVSGDKPTLLQKLLWSKNKLTANSLVKTKKDIIEGLKSGDRTYSTLGYRPGFDPELELLTNLRSPRNIKVSDKYTIGPALLTVELLPEGLLYGAKNLPLFAQKYNNGGSLFLTPLSQVAKQYKSGFSGHHLGMPHLITFNKDMARLGGLEPLYTPHFALQSRQLRSKRLNSMFKNPSKSKEYIHNPGLDINNNPMYLTIIDNTSGPLLQFINSVYTTDKAGKFIRHNFSFKNRKPKVSDIQQAYEKLQLLWPDLY